MSRFASFGDFREAYTRRAARAIREEAPELRNDLRAAAPSRSGNMAGAIRVDPRGAYTVDVTVGVDYASFTRPPGTQPHEIRPIPPNRALAFFWPVAGDDVVFARVQHPGYRPASDWYGDVVDEWPDRLERRLDSLPLD